MFLSTVITVFAATLSAQERLTITGRILDANGAAVAGGNVSLNLSDARFERQSVTDVGGNFEFLDLAEGRYEISATAKNFGTATKELRLSAGANGSVDIVLQPAQIAAEVSITSNYLVGTTDSLNEIPGSIERLDARHSGKCSRV